ncbi:M protein repeat protein, partial [Opisthorchis viverrini]
SHIQETQLKDRVAQLETMLEMHERDNQHLVQQNAMAHSTELRLNEERTSLRSEKQQLRDELDKVYMERGTMSAELEQVKENVVRLEAAKNRLEVETNELAHERQALIDSLNNAERQKAAMMDDLNTYRKESDRHAGLIARFTSEKEALAKQKAELLVQLSILERDARQQAEHIARLKGEKETLESSLFDAQELIEQLQTKQAALERETAELKLRRDTLQGTFVCAPWHDQIYGYTDNENSVLAHTAFLTLAELLRAHTNFQVELDKSQRSQRELGSQLHTELADLRSALTQAERRAKEAEEACLQAVLRADQAVSVMGRHQRLEAESTTDRETELRKSAEEVNRLTRALLAAQRDLTFDNLTLCRERDEARLYSEQERQRSLLRAAEEKAGLQERVSMLQQTVALERSHQESNVRGEQERSALRKATEEARLDKLKSSESWLDEDRRQLLRSLDDAETRYTEAEVARRRLEGDLKRTRVTMGELEQDKQVTCVYLG